MAKKKKAIIRLGENSGIANNIWLFQSLDLCGTLEWDNLLFSKKKKKKIGQNYITRKSWLPASCSLFMVTSHCLVGRVLPVCIFISFYALLAWAPRQQQWQPLSLLCAPPHTKPWIWRTGSSGQNKCGKAEREQSFRAKGHVPLYHSWTTSKTHFSA